MILTHGSNSISKKFPFIILSNMQITSNNTINCIKGYSNDVSQSGISDAGEIATNYGSYKFIKGLNTSSGHTAIQFYSDDYTTEVIENNAIQYEFIFKNGSQRSYTRNFFKLFFPAAIYYKNSNDPSGRYDIRITDNRYFQYATINGSTGNTFTYNGNYYTSIYLINSGLTSDFCHFSFTLDLPHKFMRFWINGIYYGTIAVDDNFSGEYSDKTNISFDLGDDDYLAQFSVKYAEWTDPINYTPPTEPYV